MMPAYPWWRVLFQKRPPHRHDRIPPAKYDPLLAAKTAEQHRHIRDRFDDEFRKMNERLDEIRRRQQGRDRAP